MDLYASLICGAGVAAFTYSKMGRRVGYGNAQSVWLIVGVAFILSAVFLYTLMAFVLNIH